MPTLNQPLFSDSFLLSRWAGEYAQFRGSELDTALRERLEDWAGGKLQKETAAEGAFVEIFFKRTWGYRAAGEGERALGYTCEPQFAVPSAGHGGGAGLADLALGWFDRPGLAPTPQILCEFRDVRPGLDKPQNRKGNSRSPVKQCADYLKEAAGALHGNEPIQPTWGIVSDMNELRLYWRKKMPMQHQRFVLKPVLGDSALALLTEGDAAAFQRFVFWKMFQSSMLLTTGGPSPLEKLLTEAWAQERAIESEFYREYQSYREEVFNALVDANPDFPGTRGKLVRLTQRFLDRCIFILFCEDMGAALNFPPSILRDVLAGVSTDPDYDPTDDAAWRKVKKLFAAMRDGTPFRDHNINRFNGGLFAPEPDLESLHIPSRLFCAKGQGARAEALTRHKKTLLFFSASYNFGVSSGTLERSVGLYTLGRIFEQSITELEFMEAKAEGRESITELSKRRRDGVYYTPEWITRYIVEETIGAHLSEVRQRLALDPLPTFTEEELAHYRRARAFGKKDKRFNTERVEQYVASLDRFGAELDEFKVVDPACGSGAFLLEALDRLVNERRWLAAERERVSGIATLFDADAVTKAVLSRNIYGVDISEESIEITRLALWLHTALFDRPLSSLDHTIRCGNSLIDREFYTFKQESLLNEEERGRINAFDWKAAFPEVFKRAGGKSGFDCVIGNPPYVKLQHFRRVMPDVADYLLKARRGASETPLYASTQTQNFDMYLPFIERGIELLNEGGRMGYIAPNVWLVNEYGEGLRRRLHVTRRLERWIDFKDFPVFDEAMTYTALQFYRGKSSAGVSCIFAPDGDIGATEWASADAVIAYSELPSEGPWVFLPERERALLRRLASDATPLGKLPAVAAIFQGIITSADHIYHLDRLGPGRYRHFPKKKPPVEVELEDALMRPLVSGEEAKRYQTPVTETSLLFPYDDSGDRARLYTAVEMASRFPKAWRYLRSHERELRQRESAAFDDEQWFRFGRSQNIDKQRLSKLGVAQTVPEMRVFYDERGAYCFNNVRVNGILTEGEDSAFFLMGILNSRVVDFVFRRIAKAKEPRPSGAYFEANKQYIAPLPVPHATAAVKVRVAGMARELQRLHSARRDTISAIDQRLASDQMLAAPRPPQWLWADIGDVLYWVDRNTDGLKGHAPTAWAKQVCAEKLAARLAQIEGAMSFGSTMSAAERGGELRFFVRDRCIISGVHVSEREAPLILAQWRQKARDTFVSDSMNTGRVVEWLLDLKTTENTALIEQLQTLNRALSTLESQIKSAERELDDAAYDLYGLSDPERLMIETDTRPRWDARIPTPPT
jgi:hypothetical protein